MTSILTFKWPNPHKCPSHPLLSFHIFALSLFFLSNSPPTPFKASFCHNGTRTAHIAIWSAEMKTTAKNACHEIYFGNFVRSIVSLPLSPSIWPTNSRCCTSPPKTKIMSIHPYSLDSGQFRVVFPQTRMELVGMMAGLNRWNFSVFLPASISSSENTFLSLWPFWLRAQGGG